ncbi:2OG-Fe(II) oxygenase [Tamlana sp. 2_MG-2023]|uniref:2OG-Fe(II) oxygenase n=1 Tax=unclassified Tamlana TaxID=2614803 RepID=UPI0026E2D856|nr:MULTISPECIES: 2OG-Fe(II) oxygenase [unclassified Tamlana]MDO6760029.1 2OG-Fe(II) oxygenase [Tamlana sp. 2_MG-2023]MDO6790273.1 2OG-Fe(II) oxygenase [Tamlana sp. 1_MG-2023]
MKRDEIAKHILNRLNQDKESLKQQYDDSKSKIGYFYIDNLLPSEIVNEINNQFPSQSKMSLKKSLRENKYVAAQMNNYDPILEEAIYAFQNPEVVNCIKYICSIDDLQPDEYLYAGGLSSMKKDQFLNPHLDNSHDKDRNSWRVLNLLFYVTPNWNDENGGNLELWPNGLKEKQTTIPSKFNRLIVMATHQSSWHSVSPVIVDSSRNCVSNYYFSDNPLQPDDKFHVTTFRGRPEQVIINQVLKIDSFLRMNIRKLFKKGIKENPHVYKKDN